ncbi:MAG: DUF1549 domain-containing protein, partial [Planctomycetaceae bacterium]
MRSIARHVGPLVGTLVACLPCVVFAEEAATAERIDFVRDVKPILAAHCVMCHGADMQEGGLRLHHRQTARAGGDSGPVIVPNKPAESELVRRIAAEDESERMPPVDGGDPLSPEQIATLRRWIEQGADWPDEGRLKIHSDHWAYQPIVRPEPPEIPRAEPGRAAPVRADTARLWVRNPIDQFVLARLREAGIEPSPEADRYTLIKRLSYDLLGLPPTPEEVDAFVHDGSPNAYEALVDRLLRSPHFGERWGR